MQSTMKHSQTFAALKRIGRKLGTDSHKIYYFAADQSEQTV